MANQKIIIEHQGEWYDVYMETQAMPAPIKSWSKKCNSTIEVLEKVEDLLNLLPGLLKYPEEVKKVIEKYNKEKTRETIEISIAGID